MGENMNKPVAWMFQGAFDISTYVSFEKPNPDIYPNPTPLYAHPVKELTDEEINQIFVEQTGFYFDDNPADDLALMDFAKALLLEAQEK
jgi:hypothetical protein